MELVKLVEMRPDHAARQRLCDDKKKAVAMRTLRNETASWAQISTTTPRAAKVKHIVTVGEPLGCAVANRDQAACQPQMSSSTLFLETMKLRIPCEVS